MQGALVIGQHLDLDVARPLDELLQVHTAIAERLQRLRRGGLEGCAEAARHRAPPASPSLHHRPPPSPSPDSRSPRRLLEPLRGSSTGALPPGTIGTPASRIRRRASVLSPMARMAAGGGPTQISPAASTASANAARSARKPYPGMHCVGAGFTRRGDRAARWRDSFRTVTPDRWRWRDPPPARARCRGRPRSRPRPPRGPSA